MNRRRFSLAIFLALSVVLLGFLPQTDTTSKKAKKEPAKDTTWLTHIEPNEYSFQYPKGWELQLWWKQHPRGITNNLGFEILSLLKHTLTSRTRESCGLESNTAKFSLSIRPKDSMTIEEIAMKPDIEDYNIKRLGEEKLKIGSREAIRTYYIHDGNHFAIYTYFDYKDGKYVSFGGMFGIGSDSASLTSDFKRIQESFKILK